MNYTRTPVSEWGRESLCELKERARVASNIWHMNGAPDPKTALAVGRGQAAARDGEAGRVAAFSVHTRSSTAGLSQDRARGQGPPSCGTALRYTASTIEAGRLFETKILLKVEAI